MISMNDDTPMLVMTITGAPLLSPLFPDDVVPVIKIIPGCAGGLRLSGPMLVCQPWGHGYLDIFCFVKWTKSTNVIVVLVTA